VDSVSFKDGTEVVNDIGLGQVKTYEEVYENKMFTSFDNG
jgi:hypothetical protein